MQLLQKVLWVIQKDVGLECTNNFIKEDSLESFLLLGDFQTDSRHAIDSVHGSIKLLQHFFLDIDLVLEAFEIQIVKICTLFDQVNIL